MHGNSSDENVITRISNDLAPYETKVLEIDGHLGLPVDGVLAKIDDRKAVLNNLDNIIKQIPRDMRSKSLYLSKFISATISGLFDAALNYIWNETISTLRHKVYSYDINYFYDLVINPSERSKYDGKKDLEKIPDYTLIEGALKLEILDDISYRKLDTIRYMRNNISAAHPNEHIMSGIELVSYLDICVKSVLLKETSDILISINRILKKIKEEELKEDEVLTITKSYENFLEKKLEDLCRGFFGIYCREASNKFTYRNIERLLPPLWKLLNQDFKIEMGVTWQRVILNENETIKERVNNFISLVNGKQYLPNDTKIPKLQILLEQLRIAHNNFNNFYTEINYINMIVEYIGEMEIPSQIEKQYVDTLIYVFLSNGNGVAWGADEQYKILLNKFSNKQIVNALISFKNIETKNKLNYSICICKFNELIDIFKKNATDQSIKDELERINTNEIKSIGIEEFAAKIVNGAKKYYK